MSANEIVQKILEDSKNEKIKPTTVDKDLEVYLDLGTLLAIDTNELNKSKLKSSPDDYYKDLTRGNAQLLTNAIWELPTEHVEEVLVAKLPRPKYVLPRSLPVPKPKPMTKWEKFALDKGIKKKNKSKLTYDDDLKKWIPTFGYRKAAAEKEKEWVLEVPGNAPATEDMFEKKLKVRQENVAKNEVQRMRNIAKAKGVKVPRLGFAASDKLDAKQLHIAATVAKASTASIGLFQAKLPKEKEARGIGVPEIVPGMKNRKRKLPPVSGKEESKFHMGIVDGILNKKPVLNVTKAVNLHINKQEVEASEKKGKPERGRKGGGKKSKMFGDTKMNKSKTGKKPKPASKAGKKVNRKAGGRKRR